MASTQPQHARAGAVTPVMKRAAAHENRDPELVREQIVEGQVVVPVNRNHDSLDPMVINREFAIKVNVNIGNNETTGDLIEELEEFHTVVHCSVDTVIDSSMGSNLDETRETNVAYSSAPIGIAPIYEVVKRVDSPEDITRDLLPDIIEKQAEQGVDYMMIHADVLMEYLPFTDDRETGIISRGGSVLIQWMEEHGEQNPLYVAFEGICDVFTEHDVTFSLGDGLRPSRLVDVGDDTQSAEPDTLGELTRTAWGHSAQMMVEGPDHVPMDQIVENVERQQEICDGAPFYVLGSLTTDVTPGYDHITGAIGATEARYAGAAMLCYATPKEHLGLPDCENVHEGLAAYRIAAHAVDVANDLPGVRDWDNALLEAHYEFDWARQFDFAPDPEWARPYRDQALPGDNYKEARLCSMYGVEFYSMRTDQDAREVDGEMETIEFVIDPDTSPAVDVNLPPVDAYNTDRVPDETEIDDVTFMPELAHGDD